MECADRGLWVAVLEQAREDVADMPFDSLECLEAVAFLTGGGQWREARAEVGAHLDIHPDDIKRAGVRWVLERRRVLGLPDVQPPRAGAARAVPAAGSAVPAAVPSLAARLMMEPPEHLKPFLVYRKPKRAANENPFHPAYRGAAVD